MTDADVFRDRARRCRELRKAAVVPEIIEQLTVWARDFDDQANKSDVGGRAVALYRVYFRNQYRFVVGRDDFDAEDDARAMTIARTLCDACSDVCASFELWQGVRQIEMSSSIKGPDLNFDEFAAQVQNIVLERELVLRHSQWVVAESRCLLEQTQRLLDRHRRSAS